MTKVLILSPDWRLAGQIQLFLQESLAGSDLTFVRQAITRAVSGRHVFGSEQPDVVIIDEAIKGFGSLVEAVARDAIHPGIVVLVEASGVQLVKELQSLSGALRMVDKSQYWETTIAEAFKQVLEARAAG